MDKTLEAIIKVLLEKTKAKQVNWTKSSVESQFKLILDKAAITIDFETYSDQDGEGEYDKYEVSVYNEHGNRILNEIYYESAPFNTIYPEVKELYKQIEKNIYKVDETLDSIFQELKKSDKIGKDAPEDNDIPF